MKDNSTCIASSKTEIRYNYLAKYIIDYYQFVYIKLNCLCDSINKPHLLIFFFFYIIFFHHFDIQNLISIYNYNKVSFIQNCPLTREFEFRIRSGNFGQSRIRLIPNLPDSTRRCNTVRNTNNFYIILHLSAIITLTFKFHNVTEDEL